MITTDDGAQIHAEVSGSETLPTVMFSNSLACSLAMWDDQMPAFADRYRIIRYDDRGHGKSSVPKGPYTIDRLGRDVLAVLDGLGIETVNWVGLSKGGMLGMWLGVHAPERLEKLVLADTAPFMGPASMWQERAAIAREKGMAALAEGTLQRWFTPGFHASHPERIERVRNLILTTDPEGFAGSCEAIRDMDQRADIARIPVPTLVVVGSDDGGTTPAIARDIAAAIPGAKLAELADASHLSNIEQAEAFNAAVLAFLAA